MKSGDVSILYIMKALDHIGVLEKMNLTIVLTGDEEKLGASPAIVRKELVDAGKWADIGLGFEDQRILHGGPVRRDRLYLSYFPRALTEQTMTPIFSNELEDLQLIANSQGMRYIACVGECEWEHEQLCDEIASNYWLIVSCSHDVLFDCDYNDRVKLVLSRLGISLEQLSSISGRA